jgi:predicted PolB exonuclease-like 3'-5' exonuclease
MQLDIGIIPVLVFDIETVPDTEGLRTLYGIGADVTSAQVVEVAFQRRRQATGNDFLPLHVQRVVAISCALRGRDGFKIWSLGAPDDPEAELIRRFFDGVEQYTPQLVSWNGGGFDLPVLHYRAMIHAIQAPRYWDQGEDERDFKWNNYINRYHSRHLDLMDVLALYQPRANAGLDEMAKLVGLPGKMGMDGAQVWEAFQHGEIVAIRNYCETDVANTYLLYLRFQLMRGALTQAQYHGECEVVRACLEQSGSAHWRDFLERWR